MPPRKTDETKPEAASAPDGVEVTETEDKDAKKVDPADAPAVGDLTSDTPLEERAAALEDMKRVDPTRLIAHRAVFDTSGTAGPADHDVRRSTAAWDRDVLALEEDVPEHLKKYIDGPEGLPAIADAAYSDEEKKDDK